MGGLVQECGMLQLVHNTQGLRYMDNTDMLQCINSKGSVIVVDAIGQHAGIGQYNIASISYHVCIWLLI